MLPTLPRLPCSSRLLHSFTPGHLSSAPVFASLENSVQTAEARDWLSAFRAQSIPRNLVELSFSRSSGPGGQVSPFLRKALHS